MFPHLCCTFPFFHSCRPSNRMWSFSSETALDCAITIAKTDEITHQFRRKLHAYGIATSRERARYRDTETDRQRQTNSMADRFRDKGKYKGQYQLSKIRSATITGNGDHVGEATHRHHTLKHFTSKWDVLGREEKKRKTKQNKKRRPVPTARLSDTSLPSSPVCLSFLPSPSLLCTYLSPLSCSPSPVLTHRSLLTSLHPLSGWGRYIQTLLNLAARNTLLARLYGQQ